MEVFGKIIFAYMVLVAVIVVGAFSIELDNAQTRDLELMQKARNTCVMACDFFSAESYRNNREHGNTYQLREQNGTQNGAISGQFYAGDSEYTAYMDMFFSNNEQFREYVDMLDNTGYFEEDFNFKILKEIADGSTDSRMRQYITPANLGFTYIDEKVLSKIFRWTFVNDLTSSNITKKADDYSVRENIIYSAGADGSYCRWNGFRIYYDTIKTHVTHKIYDLLNSDDATEYYRQTGLDVANYLTVSGIEEDDIRRYKIIAFVTYEMKVGYEGILPIKKIFDFIMQQKTHQGSQGTAWAGENIESPDTDKRVDSGSIYTDDWRRGNEQLGATGTWSSDKENFEESEIDGKIYQLEGEKTFGLNQIIRYTTY